MIPEAEATGRCEMRSESYVFRVETNADGRATGVIYFDRDGASSSSARGPWSSLRQRRRDAAAAADVGERAVSERTGEFERAGRQVPDVQLRGRADGVFEHELNEFKSVQVTRILHDFYEIDPKRGFYGGGGIDARIGPQPTTWAIRAAAGRPALGQRVQGAPEGISPHDGGRPAHGTSLPVETNSITLDPELKDAWGLPAIRVTYQDHPDDLATIAVPAGSRRWRSWKRRARSG